MTQEPNNYRVSLDVYAGPLDLLLYLIRREEVDIYDIPISRITEQYIKHVELLHQIDPDAVGQFLVLAATLMEIKSRMLLPTPPEEVADEDTIDPRSDLVRQLLEYKRFKDAAGDLQARADEFGKRFPRSPVIPDKDSMDLEDAEVWDLMAAFNKLMQQTGRVGYQHQVVYDDTPIATHALNIVDQLQKQGGSVEFTNIFTGKSRPQCVGMFLALLELIRRQRVRADQDHPFGQIYVFLLDARPLSAPEVAESFGPEGAPAGPVGMAARPPIGVDEPEGEQPEDSTGPTPPDDELSADETIEPLDTRPLRMEPAADPDVVPPDGGPEAQTESGAEDDEAGDDRETRRDGAEPA
jgi:segregation and condensation protein A